MAAGAIAVCSAGYYTLCLWSAAKFLRERKTGEPALSEVEGGARPAQPVSILKPLKGTDPEIYEIFRSHCLLDYPEYEIIFGVSDPADPVVVWAERLKQEFPRLRITLLICPEILGTNIKVSNLAQMAKHAQ